MVYVSKRVDEVLVLFLCFLLILIMYKNDIIFSIYIYTEL